MCFMQFARVYVEQRDGLVSLTGMCRLTTVTCLLVSGFRSFVVLYYIMCVGIGGYQ